MARGTLWKLGRALYSSLHGAVFSACAIAVACAPAQAQAPLFDAPVGYPTGGNPFVAAYGDLNGDTFQDIVTANWTSGNLSVLMSTGNMTFFPAQNYPVPASVSFVAIGDINEDGLPDIMAPVYNSHIVTIHTNNGDGTFTRRSDLFAGYFPSSVAVADLNGDGHLDLAVTKDQDYVGPNLTIYDGNGNGGFSYRTDITTSCGANRVLVGDFNQDGRSDMAVSSLYTCGPAVTVCLQDAFISGLFGSSIYPLPPGGSYGIASGDFNGDTYLDLAITWDSAGSARILMNNGDGTFALGGSYGTDRSGNDGTLSLVTADFNQDGKVDIVLANRAYDSVTPLLGNGDGTFAVGSDYFTGDGPAYLITTDLNNDGRADLVTANEFEPAASVIYGNGNGTFDSESVIPIGSRASRILTTDLDLDGDRDIVVLTQSSNSILTTLINSGDGRNYTRYTQAGFGFNQFISAGDVTGDGYPDLVIAPLGPSLLRVLVFVRHTRTWATYYSRSVPPEEVTWGLALADLNKDGWLDIVHVWSGEAVKAGAVVAYLNSGFGTFPTRTGPFDTGKAPTSPRVTDMNRDGNPDIVVANFWDGTVSVLPGKGDGTFKSKNSYGAGRGSFSIAVGDLNSDRRMDILASNIVLTEAQGGMFGGDARVPSVSVLLGTGSGNGFKSRVKYDTSPSSRSLELGDFNGDGNLDVSVLSFEYDFATVVLGNGDGTLGAKANFVTGSGPVWSSVADMNGDGLLDLVTANNSGQSVSVLLNTGSGTLLPSAAAPTVEAEAASALKASTLAAAGELEVSPNPLNPSATLKFTTTRPGPARARLFDVNGRLVRTLVDERETAAGAHEVRIDGKNERGESIATGVYFLRVETVDGIKFGRITVLK